MNILDTILDIIFPTKCLGCGKSSYYLCSSCLSSSPQAERECAKWIFPVFDYRHPVVKKSIWLLKYKNKRKLAEIFAEPIYLKLMEELSDLETLENFTKPVLVPIPLSKERFKERGFNQSELICNALIRIGKENKQNTFEVIKDVLVKKVDTVHQANIENRSTRLKNLKGTFGIKNENSLKGRNIILVDDIITTGATLNEARKVLKEMGAKKIIAVTIAH